MRPPRPAQPSTPNELIDELRTALYDAMYECCDHNKDYHHTTPEDKFKYWSWLLKVPFRTTIEYAGFKVVEVRAPAKLS